MMGAEQRLEQSNPVDHTSGILQANQTDVDWTRQDTSCWMAGHRPKRPNMRTILKPLEPLHGADESRDQRSQI